ncbi:unnamed protein product [Fusarium venenatum]|uniref:Uncharacterized protein n=1 Tax=Fusarium venenatum TaxID=56646 RepID=A0A2L2TIF2_9HYPO|nr:LOW QUALITY PROTEIN: uncharacterized protein FVRRES_10819 [Fusarium venenatum]CEI70742.1 unnamed protein product [Fusarium venenatum]
MLDRRIDRSHRDWFMRHMKDIIDALKELRSMLPFEKCSTHNGLSSLLTDLESTIFRLKISFSHKKVELLETINNRNDELRNCLYMSSQLHISRTSLQTTKDTKKQARSLGKQQEQESVFSGFKSQWICCCNPDKCHSCGISTEGSDIKRLLNGARNHHLKIVVVQSEVKHTTEPSTVPTQADLRDLTQKSIRKRILKNMRKQGNSISRLVPSKLLTLSNTNNNRTNNKHDKSFERLPENLKKRNKKESSVNITRTPKVQFNLPSEPVETPTSMYTVNFRGQAISDMCLQH